MIPEVAEACVQGVSTRKVEALVQTLGMISMSKSGVSRWRASLALPALAFRARRLDVADPFVWLDAGYEHLRAGHRALSMVVIVA